LERVLGTFFHAKPIHGNEHAWSPYVPTAKVKLDEISKILGLTGKPEGVDGSRVEEMVLAGQIEEVALYCESDVLNTYRVWLVYELFRGAITAKELDWSERQVKDFVASRKVTNPHLCAAVGIRTHDAQMAPRLRMGRLALCSQPSDLITQFGGELRPDRS
jgi:hypothetical protein